MKPWPDSSSRQVIPRFRALATHHPTMTFSPYASGSAPPGSRTVSPAQTKCAGPPRLTAILAYSSLQFAGRGGGDQSRSRMLQPTPVGGVSRQPMFPLGERMSVYLGMWSAGA